MAVELAILHNFCWHERWTWSDRQHSERWLARFVRFHAANGFISLVTNVLLTSLLSHALHLPPVPANVIAVGASAIANFVAADRWDGRRVLQRSVPDEPARP